MPPSHVTLINDNSIYRVDLDSPSTKCGSLRYILQRLGNIPYYGAEGVLVANSAMRRSS